MKAADAQAAGAETGRVLAAGLVEKIRQSPHLLSGMVDALQAGETAGADALTADGEPARNVRAWRLGYYRGADPLVRALLAEMKALEAAAHLEAGLKAAGEAVALAEALAPSPQPHALALGRRPLRPEDFGVVIARGNVRRD